MAGLITQERLDNLPRVGTPASAPSTLRVNRAAFEATCAAHGLNSDAQVAAALGVTRSVVWKVRTGVHAPSERFIAGVMRAWPGLDLGSLLTPVDYQPARQGAR